MRFHGMIGFVKSVDRGDGVFVNQASEVETCGDVNSFRRRWLDDTQNGDVLYSNTVISVPLSPTVSELLPNIKYVKWHDCCWQVVSLEEVPPRINLTLGGVYNGFTA